MDLIKDQAAIMKLNLGCGTVRKDGMLNADNSRFSRADILFDFEAGFPFRDGSFDYVYAHYLFEHIQDLYPFIEEIYRVCRDRAVVEIHVPHAVHHAALSHPDHKHTFTWSTFDFLTRSESSDRYIETDVKFRYLKRRFMYADCNQKKRSLFARFVDWFSNRFPFHYERLFSYWVGGSEEIIYFLQVIK